MGTDEAERYIEILLKKENTSKRPRFRRMPTQPLQALIPNLLYRCRLLDTVENRTVSLTMFLRLGDLGGALWEQEMRILERVTGLAHPSLPDLEDGGYLPGPDGSAGAAYIWTKTQGTPGDVADLQRLFRERRGDALPQLWLLADALAVLADAHVAHRMLWPGNLDVTKTDDTVESVRLSRFEMGALISNLFDSGHDLSLVQVRDLYLQQPHASLLYTPPERLRFLFGKPDGQLGGPAGDVFSLGMMATEWLLGSADDRPVQLDYDDILRRQAATRTMLERRANELPSSLAQILTDMLDSQAGGRPTAYQVALHVNAAYGDAREVLDDNIPTEPYVLAYMPNECDKTLLKWGAIKDSALTPEGQDQLVELIERDTRGAEVLHSANGAEGFANGAVDKLRRATTVIVGHEITWFGETLWVQQDGIVEFDEILVIKYVRFTSDVTTKLDALRVTALPRRVPVTEPIPMPTETEVAEFWSAGRPTWSSLVLKVESGRVLPEEEKGYLEALDWYLRYQRGLLAARTYAYVLEPTQKSGHAMLRWDHEADIARVLDDPLQRKMVLDTRRLAMPDFVSGGGEQAGINDGTVVRVSLAESPDGFRSAQGPFAVLETGTSAVEIDTSRQRNLPKRGWLRLESDGGTVPQINRQAEARVELETQRALLRQLIQPRTRPILDGRWDAAGGNLSGEGRAAVVAMLKHGALFALQGPPGTGKTEVTAQAVAEYVTTNPRARVLVSAQSHDALENLAGRILDKLGMTNSGGLPARLDRLALRLESSRPRDRVDSRVEAFQPGRLADGVISYSMSRARHWLTWRRSERPALTPVVQEWLNALPTSRLELSRRAQAAANVVFATTGAATRKNLVSSATDEPFHWVLVEEAARAWPTELALPLVRGSRWTLIGDHAQIGAFSKTDIERFLLECKDHPAPEIRAMYMARESYARAFGTFAELFNSTRPDVPRMTLTQQYRMDEQISTLVGDIFYADSGGLRACREPAPHPLTGPDYLLKSRLIWVDTGQAEHARGFWYNDNEADLCARVVRAMGPSPGTTGGGPGLVLLTPYRRQVSLLEQRISEHASQVFTIDGFQGREADIVVASLVRDVVGRDGTPVSSVGHVASAARTNVLLSRARELLVLVGRWEIYAKHAGPKWRDVAEHFRQYGSIISAERVRQS